MISEITDCVCAGQAAPKPVGQAAAAKAGADTAEEAGHASRKASQTAPVTPLVSPREQEQGTHLAPEELWQQSTKEQCCCSDLLADNLPWHGGSKMQGAAAESGYLEALFRVLITHQPGHPDLTVHL